MTTLWAVWISAAMVLLILAGLAGTGVKGTPLGLLLDQRDRYSLNRFQLLCWLWIILSMAAGVGAVRFTVPNARPLGFSIPGPVLALLGTVGGTTVASSAVKAYRDSNRSDSVAASLGPATAFLGQMLLQEEGAGADQTLDVGKFQALVTTIFLGAGYVLTSIYEFIGRDSPPITDPSQITQLPALDPTFVALLAISAGSYVGTKLITRTGIPPLSLAERDQHVSEVLDQARADGPVDGRKMRKLLRTSNVSPADRAKPPVDAPQVGDNQVKPGTSRRVVPAPAGSIPAGRGVPLDTSH